MHLPCAGVPSPAPSPACLAAPRTVAVVADVLAALAGVVGVLALMGPPAVAVAAAFLAVEDTRVAADNPGAGTCTGRTHAYGRLPELEGISGSDFIGWYSYRGSDSYRGSYGYPCCCGYPYSSQVVWRTCRARKTGKTWEGKSRGSHRIERADRVERVGRPKQTGGNSRGK